MSTKISSEQRRYLRERIQALFQDAENILQDRSISRRSEIAKQVLESAGIEKAKEQARKIVDQITAFNEKSYREAEKLLQTLDELNQQFKVVVGIDLITAYGLTGSRVVTPGQFNSFSHQKGTALGRLIDEEMTRTPEGAQIAELHTMKLAIEDRLMLDYDGKSGGEILTEVQAAINAIVNRAKALKK